MRIQLSFAALFAAVFACTMHAAPAQAQRVFVSATGSDGNPCTFALPCRSFQHAHDVAAAGGEIDVLDPAGYGALTIAKAISIQGHGYSGISVASGGTGITINGAATDEVNLNGLLIDGSGVGLNGIVLNTGQSLTIAGCVVRDVTNDGIDILPTGSTSYTIVNTIASDNGRVGIYVAPHGAGAAQGTITGTTASHNGYVGIFVNGDFSSGAASQLSIFSSNASSNGNTGVSVQDSFMSILARDTTASNNGFAGFVTTSGAQMWLAHSMASGNSQGLSSVGSIGTYGDNNIVGNTAKDINATLTPVSPH
jgi:hypothetical protein